MCGSGSTPAAKEDIEADNQVDEPNDAQPQGQAPVQRFGDDFDRGIQRDAGAGDGVIRLAVAAGVIERALQVGHPDDGDVVHLRQQVVRLDAGALPGHLREDPFRFQAARCFAPPDPVVGLLEVAFLAKIQNRKHEQTGRGYGQQGRLQTVEEASFHEGNALHHLICCTRVAMKEKSAVTET